jgi:hypothetical protein
MNEKLRNHVNILFAAAPKTAKAEEIKEELLTNLNDKYNDLLANGYDSTAAFHIALSDIGNMDELFRECAGVTHAVSVSGRGNTIPVMQPVFVNAKPSSMPMLLGLAFVLTILGPGLWFFWILWGFLGLAFFSWFSCWAIAGGILIYTIASLFTRGSRQAEERYQRHLLAQAEQCGLTREPVHSELRSLGRTNKLQQVVLVLVIILLSFFTISLAVGAANAWHKGKPWFGAFFNEHVPTGPVITQEREIGDFSKVDVSGALSVEFISSDKNLVVVETHDDVMPYIRTSVHNNSLTITRDNSRRFRNVQKLHITVYGKNEPRLFAVHGASRLSCTEPLKTDNIKFKLNDASKINITNLIGGSVDLDLVGASAANVAGKAEHVSFQMHGASKAHASGLETDKCDVSISGACKADMGTIHKELSVSASGASHFSYRGTPTIKKQEVSGASKIHSR